jgi:hypothetical protein
MPVMLIKKSLVDLIKNGRKTTTIRLGRRKVKTGALTFLSGRDTLKVEVTRVEYKSVERLSQVDAQRDGFSSLEDLIRVLRSFYPDMEPGSEVTLVHFELPKD